MNGTLENEVYEVIWQSVTAYGIDGGTVTAVARIGSVFDTYGFILDEVTYNVEAETIVDYDMPGEVRLNPYAVEGIENALNNAIGAPNGMLSVTTSSNRDIALSVKYGSSFGDIGYAVEQRIDTTADVGITIDFGGVESVVDENGNSVGTALDVRQGLPLAVVVEARVAVGISTWFTDRTTSLAGSIYDTIDFDNLGTMTVVAVTASGSNPLNDNTDFAAISSFTPVANATSVSGEVYAALAATDVAGEGGRQIQRIYYDAEGNVYYFLYRGAGVSEQTIQTGGQYAYVRSYDEGVTVLFAGGEEEQYSLSFDTSNLRYSFTGGTYYVSATLGSGNLTQTFGVRVEVRSADLEGIALTPDAADADVEIVSENGRITGIVVDPYVGGFETLPDEVFAFFTGYDSPVRLAVNWDYARISQDMSTAGGEYLSGDNRALVAFVYVEAEDGSRSAVQSIEVNVEVLKRELVGIYVSRDPASVATDTLLDAAPAGYSEFTTLMTINPYTDRYSENWNDNFTYYKSAYVEVETDDGTKYIVFDIDENAYTIRDLTTGRPTNTSNLYTGRRIAVNFSFGATGPTAASDARFTDNNITVTILNMTYVSGLTTEYTIDVYGVRDGLPTSPADITEPTNVKFETVSGNSFTGNVTFDRTNSDLVFTGSGYGQEIGVDGGLAVMYAVIGSDWGGYQRIPVYLNYLDRRIDTLFDVSEAAPYAYDTDYDGKPATLHFEIDPFAVYSPAAIYPQSGQYVTFMEDATLADRDTTSFAVAGGSGHLSVTWDDSRVVRNYTGSTNSYVTATVSYNGAYSQTVTYRVIVYDRTVTGFTNLLRNDDGNSVVDDDGNIKPIRPYDYMYADDLSQAIAADYLTSGVFTVEFGNVQRNPEYFSISFTLGAAAENFSANGKYPFGQDVLAEALTASGESDMSISFVLDSARGISYQGRDARFYVAIPGFALGTDGQQLARQDLPVEEQYIFGITFSRDDSLDANPTSYDMNYSQWLVQAAGESGGELVNQPDNDASYYYDTYDVDNPYYFIERGGLLLPNTAVIHVGSISDLTDENGNPLTEGTYEYALERYDIESGNINGSYQIELNWNNVVNGREGSRSRISYTGGAHAVSFRMDLDDQSYQLRFNIADGWVLDNDVIISSGARYSEDEVILLPSNSANDAVTITPTTLGGNDVYNNYTVTFANGREYTFSGVAGGGSYSDNYMKWSFDEVRWSNANTAQYATLTLGGRGGQTVRWEFYVDPTKTLVNNSVPTMYALDVGETIELPTTYRQMFAGYNLSNATVIPVSYSAEVTGFYRGTDYPLGIERSGNTVTGRYITPSYKYQQDMVKNEAVQWGISLPDPNHYAGYILWDATEYRAYPSPDESVGGRIVFCVYDDPTTYDLPDAGGRTYNNLATYGIMLHNPDAMYGYSELRPVMSSDYTYPDQLPSTTSTSVSFTQTGTMTSYKFPTTGYYVKNSGGTTYTQNAVPNIRVAQGAMFDLRYLPMMSMTLYRPAVTVSDGGFLGGTTTYAGVNYDVMYLIPWQDATVYYLADRYSAPSGSQGNIVSGGFAAIDTGSRVGARYTLVTSFYVGSARITVTCCIDIV